MTRGRDYEVGYGKPPKSTRFRKGQSGNPAGRRKGSFNLGTIVRRELGGTRVVGDLAEAQQVEHLDRPHQAAPEQDAERQA